MKDHAPSAERNRHDILPELRDVLAGLDASPRVLEIASGTGQHAVHFARHLPDCTWRPSDRTERALASIRAWAAAERLDNLQDPVLLDVTDPDWPDTVGEVDALVAINMLHISPWSACLGLLDGASRCLNGGGPLFYYGAFFRGDRDTAPSNLEFDRSLRGRDPDWGVRQLEDVVAAAADAGLRFDRITDMPNHNYVLVLRQS